MISPRGAAPEAWSKIREEMECDARLVAEAPTMLRKLREIAQRGYSPDHEILQIIEFIEKGTVTKP